MTVQRSLSLTVLAGLMTACSDVAPAPSTLTGLADAQFPVFEFEGEIFDKAQLSYNPTNEFIFPSVIRAADYFEDPLATYYLYYAPHEAPGGMALAYADSLDGPWTEYEGNPLFTRTWEPHYDVSHISSPHAIWIEEEQRLFLYFHGENTETRFATSSDGLHFEYGGVAVTAKDAGPSVAEASYAQVFEHTIPGRDNRYLMLFMDAVPDVGAGLNARQRRIRLAISQDARTWTVDPQPLISPQGEEGQNLSGPHFFPWEGRNFVVYHASSGNMHVTEVGEAFDQENHLGVFYDSATFPPDRGRSAAPTFYTVDDTMHMFYEAGGRLTATIAHAKADVSQFDLPKPDLTCSATPEVLWPPNRKLVQVTPSLGIDDGVLGPYGFTLDTVASSEPDSGVNRGDRPNDIQDFAIGTPDTQGSLRAERAVPGEGRTYTLGYTARDAFGYEAGCAAKVDVPRDQSR